MSNPKRCAREGGECGNPTDEPHGCPYQSEINDDDAFQCRCCAECEQECAWDI